MNFWLHVHTSTPGKTFVGRHFFSSKCSNLFAVRRFASFSLFLLFLFSSVVLLQCLCEKQTRQNQHSERLCNFSSAKINCKEVFPSSFSTLFSIVSIFAAHTQKTLCTCLYVCVCVFVSVGMSHSRPRKQTSKLPLPPFRFRCGCHRERVGSRQRQKNEFSSNLANLSLTLTLGTLHCAHSFSLLLLGVSSGPSLARTRTFGPHSHNLLSIFSGLRQGPAILWDLAIHQPFRPFGQRGHTTRGRRNVVPGTTPLRQRLQLRPV